MELLQVSVILVVYIFTVGASIAPPDSTSIVELVSSEKTSDSFKASTRHVSASANKSESSENPRRLTSALKNQRVQAEKHIRGKKSVLSDALVGCITATDARGVPQMLCGDPASINPLTTSHTTRNVDPVNEEGEGQLEKEGKEQLNKEGDGKIFSGLLPGSATALHTSVIHSTLPGYSGVQSSNLSPAYGGVSPGLFGGGYSSSLIGGYAGLYPGYSGCQPYYPGSSFLPYNHILQPLTPIVPTSYFHKPVQSIASTADVASHLYKHTAHTKGSHGGFGYISAQKADLYPTSSFNPSSSFRPTQFSSSQEAIRQSQMNVFNPTESQRGFGHFSAQEGNRDSTFFPVTQETIPQFPVKVFNSIPSQDTSAHPRETVSSQMSQGNSRTSNHHHIDFPALPQINNFLPTMQLPTGQSVRSTGSGLGVFPRGGDAYCGGIPLLASCTPNVIVGKLIQNGFGELGAYGGGNLNKAYGSFRSAYSAPWFGGSPYGNAYYRESLDESSSPTPVNDEKVYKKIYTPLKRSEERQKKPAEDEKKTEEKSKNES